MTIIPPNGYTEYARTMLDDCTLQVTYVRYTYNQFTNTVYADYEYPHPVEYHGYTNPCYDADVLLKPDYCFAEKLTVNPIGDGRDYHYLDRVVDYLVEQYDVCESCHMQPTPEPSTVVMLMLGVILVWVSRRWVQ